MKKGFTLLELLAVIILLGVIAVIALPRVINVVDKTKKDAFKQTVVGVIKSAENYLADNILTNPDIKYPIEFTCNGEECSNGKDKLNFKGEVPISGKIVIESIKNIYAIDVSDGENCLSGNKSNVIKGPCNCEDKEAPTLSVLVENNIIKLSYSDNKGVVSYCVTKEENVCTWVDALEASTDVEVEESGTYYVYVKDATGNITSVNNVEVVQTIVYGLYTEDDELVVSWDDLVNVYGLDISKSCGATGGTGCGLTVLSTNNLTGILLIPPTVTKIGKCAFRASKNILGVYIPSSVVEIGAEAFNKSSIKNAYFENTSNWYAQLSDGEVLVKVTDPATAADAIKRQTSGNKKPLVKWINKTN